MKVLMGCPAWLALSKDRRSFIFMPERAEIVKTIFELSIAGLGGYTIAKQLNAKMIPAFGPSPIWDQSTIHNLLSNRATFGEHQPRKKVNGERVPDGDPIPHFYPAVIEEKLFVEAQLARRNNLAAGRGRKGRLVTNLFRGVAATCFYCASAAMFKSKSSCRLFICSKTLNDQDCYRAAWTYQNFEDSILAFLVETNETSEMSSSNQEGLRKSVELIKSLSGPDPYVSRLALTNSLRSTIKQLRVAAAGQKPNPTRLQGRIRHDLDDRYVEINLGGDITYKVFPILC